MDQLSNSERSIQDVAEEIKRARDGRETLKLSTELLDKAKRQSAEIDTSMAGSCNRGVDPNPVV